MLPNPMQKEDEEAARADTLITLHWDGTQIIPSNLQQGKLVEGKESRAFKEHFLNFGTLVH